MTSEPTPELIIVDDSPEGDSFTLELPALPSHLAGTGATWTMQKLHISVSTPRYGAAEYRETKPPEPLAEQLAPGSHYVLDSELKSQHILRVRAVALSSDGRVLVETPMLNVRGVNVLHQPNPGRRTIKSPYPPGPLTFEGFAPSGYYGEKGLRAAIRYPQLTWESQVQMLVQQSRDGQTWETIEETRRDNKNGGPEPCSVPVEAGGEYWLRAFERTKDTETPSLDVLHIKVPASKS